MTTIEILQSHGNDNVTETYRKKQEPGRGFFGFLTWPFFLAQVWIVQHFIGDFKVSAEPVEAKEAVAAKASSESLQALPNAGVPHSRPDEIVDDANPVRSAGVLEFIPADDSPQPDVVEENENQAASENHDEPLEGGGGGGGGGGGAVGGSAKAGTADTEQASHHSNSDQPIKLNSEISSDGLLGGQLNQMKVLGSSTLDLGPVGSVFTVHPLTDLVADVIGVHAVDVTDLVSFSKVAEGLFGVTGDALLETTGILQAVSLADEVESVATLGSKLIGLPPSAVAEVADVLPAVGDTVESVNHLAAKALSIVPAVGEIDIAAGVSGITSLVLDNVDTVFGDTQNAVTALTTFPSSAGVDLAHHLETTSILQPASLSGAVESVAAFGTNIIDPSLSAIGTIANALPTIDVEQLFEKAFSSVPIVGDSDVTPGVSGITSLVLDNVDTVFGDTQNAVTALTTFPSSAGVDLAHHLETTSILQPASLSGAVESVVAIGTKTIDPSLSAIGSVANSPPTSGGSAEQLLDDAFSIVPLVGDSDVTPSESGISSSVLNNINTGLGESQNADMTPTTHGPSGALLDLGHNLGGALPLMDDKIENPPLASSDLESISAPMQIDVSFLDGVWKSDHEVVASDGVITFPATAAVNSISSDLFANGGHTDYAVQFHSSETSTSAISAEPSLEEKAEAITETALEVKDFSGMASSEDPHSADPASSPPTVVGDLTGTLDHVGISFHHGLL